MRRTILWIVVFPLAQATTQEKIDAKIQKEDFKTVLSNYWSPLALSSTYFIIYSDNNNYNNNNRLHGLVTNSRTTDQLHWLDSIDSILTYDGHCDRGFSSNTLAECCESNLDTYSGRCVPCTFTERYVR